VRAAADRECDCGQGDLPLVARMNLRRRVQGEREGLRAMGAAAGSWQLMLVPVQARCDGSVAAGGSAEVVECGASAGEKCQWVRLQAERPGLLWAQAADASWAATQACNGGR
jgi:hypothetical protein